MSLDISLKTEARLAAKAREQGLSIDAFLERLLNDAGDLTASTANGEPPRITRLAPRHAPEPSSPGYLRRCRLIREGSMPTFCQMLPL
jgi:hypothetical protein